MSLGEISQVYSVLQEIDVILSKLEVKTETMRLEAAHVTGTLRELEYLSYRIISLLGRLGLPKEVDEAIRKLQQLILTMRMVHTMSRYLESSSPYWWAIGVMTGIGAIIVGTDAAGYSARGKR